jgi:hypothetical protein
MQKADERKRFIERTDFRVRKGNQIYCPHAPPKSKTGTSRLFEEKEGIGFEQVLEVQYLNLLLNNGESNFYPCPLESEIDEARKSSLSDEEIVKSVCGESCRYYNLNKRIVART